MGIHSIGPEVVAGWFLELVARRIYCLEVFIQRGIVNIVASRVPGDVEERGEFMGS